MPIFTKKIKHYAKEIFFFMLFIGIFMNVISLYKAQELNKQELTIRTHKLIDASTYVVPNDKPLMLHFWATWCPICKAESDNIERLSHHYNVVTVAVNSGTDYEIKKYLNERGLTFKVINDKNSSLAKHFNVNVFPTTFIYDKNKKLVFSEVGYTSSFGLWIRMLWASL